MSKSLILETTPKTISKEKSIKNDVSSNKNPKKVYNRLFAKTQKRKFSKQRSNTVSYNSKGKKSFLDIEK